MDAKVDDIQSLAMGKPRREDQPRRRGLAAAQEKSWSQMHTVTWSTAPKRMAVSGGW